MSTPLCKPVPSGLSQIVSKLIIFQYIALKTIGFALNIVLQENIQIAAWGVKNTYLILNFVYLNEYDIFHMSFLDVVSLEHQPFLLSYCL